MKIEMQNYGATFNLRCPRCGNDEWSDEVYNSGSNAYHKCLQCGADVCSDGHASIGIVIESLFYVFTPNTYDMIGGSDGTQSIGWKLPAEKREGVD